MVVLQSSLIGIREEKERICNNRMANDEDKSKLDPVHDGETPDLESVKSIGSEDLKVSKQSPKSISPPTATPASKATTPTMTTTMTTTAAVAASGDSSNKYWMKDLYNYSYARGYSASGLYSLAWAQAVQNKPLNEVLGEFQQEEGGEEQSAVGSNEETIPIAPVGDDSLGNNDSVDDEREEGELEEGEIDLEYEPVQVEEKGGVRGRFDSNVMDDEEEWEDRVPLIRKVLENVNTSEAEKSFDVVCARLRSSVESLQHLVLHCWFPSKDALIEQSFMGFKCVNSVFLAMSPEQREQNRSTMTRLITYVMGLQPALFSAEQRKEIESIMAPLNMDGSQRSNVGDNQEEVQVAEKAILTDSNTLAVNGTLKEADLQSDKKGTDMSEVVRRLKLPNVKGRMSIGPLLDLHSVHHLDNLPSPTHKDPSPHPVSQMAFTGKFAHPYEKDALKAVTSYQQKFAHRTFLSNDLPSPTPSDEGKNEEVDDMKDDVSSYSSPIPNFSQSQPVSLPKVDFSASTTSLAMQRLAPTTTAGLRGPAVGPPQVKSRDPRLRHMVPDLSDTPAMKKQKSGPEVARIAVGNKDINNVLGISGLKNNSPVGHPVSRASPATDPRKIHNVAASGSGQMPLNTSTSITLQSLLRDIAGNPAAWKNIFEEQRKFTGPSKTASYPANPTFTPHSMPFTTAAANPTFTPHSMPFTTAASVKPSMMVQQTGGVVHLPPTASQMNPQDKSAKVRMKPRDPRRVLHTSSTESTNSTDAVLATKNAVKESLDSQKHVNGTETNVFTSGPNTLPDITRQFTKSLKNMANIVTVSRPVQSSLNSQSPSEGGTTRMDANSAPGLPLTSNSKQDEVSLKPEEGASGPARSWTSLTGLEHIFDGYDDTQRIAIQKERARRIDEQRKMFASRKLCLVLDLDHTLLNSAKFSEVDPVHNEILRKKEEQDREKPHRHLFCFPHMQMWTKLRPGIWNFLEKACKLFELHLYTMGNKLYATEMAKVLDPTGVLFSGRVISRGDDGDPIDGDDRVPKSKDLEGVLGMESAVVIIDDSVKVWPHNKLNLIVVERYIYFPCSRRQFGLPGPSLLEIDHDERPEDGTLAASLSVIERLHRNFFSHERLDDVDVRHILAFEQKKILSGCKIVFSRVFPVGEVHPHLHPLWKTAEQFGANCTNQIDEEVTHVVANSLGTDKVNWALAKGRFVVHPGWVEASALLYRRANEVDFAIKS